MVGASIIGMSSMGILLHRISFETKTAVSVASCLVPSCRISQKCFLSGAGRSLGGWSPKTPPKTMQFHFSPGDSDFSPLISSIHTLPSKQFPITCKLSICRTYFFSSQPKHSLNSFTCLQFSSLCSPQQSIKLLAFEMTNLELVGARYCCIALYQLRHHSKRYGYMCSTMKVVTVQPYINYCFRLQNQGSQYAEQELVAEELGQGALDGLDVCSDGGMQVGLGEEVAEFLGQQFGQVGARIFISCFEVSKANLHLFQRLLRRNLSQKRVDADLELGNSPLSSHFFNRAFLLFCLGLPSALLPGHQKGVLQLDHLLLGIHIPLRELLARSLHHDMLGQSPLIEELHLDALLSHPSQDLASRQAYLCRPQSLVTGMHSPQYVIGFVLLHRNIHTIISQMPPSHLHTYPKVFNKNGNLKALPLRSPISANYFNIFWIVLGMGCLCDAFITWSRQYAPNTFLYKDRTELLLRKRSFDTLILGNKLESGEEQVRDRSIF